MVTFGNYDSVPQATRHMSRLEYNLNPYYFDSTLRSKGHLVQIFKNLIYFQLSLVILQKMVLFPIYKDFLLHFIKLLNN